MAELPNYQVTAHRPDNADADRRLQGLGGSGWYNDIDSLIAGIESKIFRLWTTTPDGKSVWVKVEVRPRTGRKYLKTEADGVEPNNLLALPRC